MQLMRAVQQSALAFSLLIASLCLSGGSSWVIGAAHAQQGTLSGGQGRGAGGTSEGVATPQGSESGGTTAGASAGQGDPSGKNTGPGPVNQTRYGGGIAPAPPSPTPSGADIPSADTPTLTTSAALASIDRSDSGSGGEAYVMGRGGRCEDYELGRMTVAQRIAGANLERLAAAEAYLASQHIEDGPKTPMYILANYQQELEQTEPSLALAGTYIGLVTIRRITPQVVIDLNNILCLATAQAQAEVIAQSAETQRLVVR